MARLRQLLGWHQDAPTQRCGFVVDEGQHNLFACTTSETGGSGAALPGLPANWEAIETPFIVRHDGYFYLFTSWDLCCRGLKSTYKTMAGRSKSIIGPYVDANGKELADGGGTELLLANSRWLGPGGGSVYLNSQNQGLIIFHAYDSKTGKPSMQLSTIDWTGGWPHVGLEQ
jgi:arabinan endo-1,5-alpha-L-arabinosidase